MSALFNGDNSDSESELKINTGYANNYDSWRQKEELNKLKTKYGNLNNVDSVSSNEDSEDSSHDEEEEDDVLKEQFDKDFYKTLACLKNKDPKIYSEDVSFFNDTNKAQEALIEKKKAGERSKKEEAVFLRDYERKIIVEREGKFSDSEDEGIKQAKQNATNKLTYVQEQHELKDSFKRVLIDDDTAETTDLLTPRAKTESEKQKEEADYKLWLKGQAAKIDEREQNELKPLRDFWSDPNLNANEKFLRDYVLNNKYLDKSHSKADLAYQQVVHDSDENLSEDEKNIEKQEEFEHKYNFRFEEPDQEFIKRYPRTMENSLRKKDTRRAQKRAEVKQRKESQKLKKKEELKQLKALKRKEIEEKIEKLKEITGNDDIKFDAIDLDGDFDPNDYDRKMTEIFNDDYYGAPEGDVKPEFPDIDEELDIEHTWDTYDPNTDAVADGDDDGTQHCEDENFNMDADYDETKIGEEIAGETSKRKRRRRTKFAELISKKKPKFDPRQYQSYEEYFDKYYSLDYEDMIGDMPCRFKYRKVVPNDYGLSVEEILTADDKELNKWCSLKKALQYKPDHIELNEVRTYKQKAKDDALKRRILRSLYSAPEEGQDESNETVTNAASAIQSNDGEASKKKRRRNKKKVKVDYHNTSCDKPTESTFTQNGKRKRKGAESNNKKDTVAEESKDLPQVEEQKWKKGSWDQPEPKKQKIDDFKDVASVEDANKSEKLEDLADAPIQPISSMSSEKGKLKKKFNKSKKKILRSNGNRNVHNDIISINSERLKTYGISAKKLKKKLKYGKGQ